MSTTMIGAKGSDVYSSQAFQTVGEKMVELSALLTRGVSKDTVDKSLHQVFLDGLSSKQLEDIFVLAFQTRDIRGGKGERDASKHIFDYLLKHHQSRSLALHLLDLVPEYGCWQDLFKLDPENLRRVKEIVKEQFEKDEAAIAAYNTPQSSEVEGFAGAEPDIKKKPSVSLLAKWLPREGQSNVIEMACALVPGSMLHGTRMKLYRKRVAAVNKFLQTVEVQMCAKTWADIVPGSVPGRAVKKYVKAFLNEKGTTKKGQVVQKGLPRHPNDADRIACRLNFQEHFAKTATGEVKAKGADTLFPHEVVKKACRLLEIGQFQEGHYRRHSEGDTDDECDQSETHGEAERNHLRGVWSAMVEAAKEGGGLGRSLAMCDFSGSMQNSSNGDTPYWVSMALGLLISEVTTEEFKNNFLTFDSNPQFHTLPDCDLLTRLKTFNPSSMSQGTSTDFQKAMDLVLAQCKAKRVRPGQEPENLIVLTDMAWDQACGSAEQGSYTGNHYRNVVKTDRWQTHVEMIRESFKRAGEDMWGEGQGLNMPTLVIWNLAATCQDFHAKADTEGVVMLSGWSPSLFKVLQNKGVVKMTPEAALRIQLDDPLYDKVRQRCQEFFAKELAYFTKEIHQPKLMQNTFTTGSPLW